MASNRKWTQEEDNILIKNVIENYDNLTGIAFPRTALELDRPISGCRQRWYNIARTQSICFTSISEKKAIKNRKILSKNAKLGNDVIEKKNKLRVIMNRIKELFT